MGELGRSGGHDVKQVNLCVDELVTAGDDFGDGNCQGLRRRRDRYVIGGMVFLPLSCHLDQERGKQIERMMLAKSLLSDVEWSRSYSPDVSSVQLLAAVSWCSTDNEALLLVVSVLLKPIGTICKIKEITIVQSSKYIIMF